MCGCALKAKFASLPARSTMRANPAVLKGAPRSEVNTKALLGFLLALQPPQGPQFVPKDRMGARCALLDPAHVQGGRSELHLIPTQVHKLRSPQAVPIGHEDHRRVPLAPTVPLGLVHQPLDLGLGQIFAGAQVGIGEPLGGNCSIYGGWRDQLEV